MRKTILTLLLGIISLTCISCANNSPTSYTDSIVLSSPTSNHQQMQSKSDSVIALLLYNDIDNAIQTYYGKPTQFALYEAKISSIQRIDDSFGFNVTIEVPTFYGAHNPPYGLEEMIFAITPGETKLKSYTHFDLKT